MSAIQSWQQSVGLKRPTLNECQEFIDLMQMSRDLHYPWVFPPTTENEYKAYCLLRRQRNEDGFLIINLADNSIAGVINLSVITRGALDSAYISYYGTSASMGKGLMTLGMHAVLNAAFNGMRLHRLEANIQPGNIRSKQLVARCGFVQEGYSKKLLKVNGHWCDHERWALIKEDYCHPV